MKTYHKNPRTLTHKQQAQLLESLEDLGDLSGIVHNLDTDEIVGGNQRSSIFNVNTCEIEMTHEADTPDEQGTVGLGFILWKGKRYTYRQVRWDAKRAERANIQANKLGGSWDFDVLANQFDVDDLLTWGFEPFELGIEPEKPEPGKDTPPKISRANELQAEWGTELGQLWQCGPHRVICGDCTDADVVERLMDGVKADLVHADPPYGMNLDASFSNSIDNEKKGAKASGGYAQVIGDDEEFDPTPLLEMLDEVKEHFWWGADYFADKLPKGGSFYVWDKRASVEDVDYSSSEFELCWSKQKKHRKIIRVPWMGIIGMEAQDTKSRVHPNQKALAVIEFILKLSDGLTLDPFLGSGTTLIAAYNLNRICYGCEISPAYVAVILQRFKDHSGIEPELIE